MSDVTIRRLTVADVQVTKALHRVFAEAFEEPELYQQLPTDSYLASWLKDEKTIVLVAEDKSVVGGLVAYQLQKLADARPEIYLYDIAVAELCRKQGIATKLVSELKHIAKNLGASTIYVQAHLEDQEALQFYRSLNYKEESGVTHFDIPID